MMEGGWCWEWVWFVGLLVRCAAGLPGRSRDHILESA